MLCNAVFGDNGRGGDILGAIYNVQGDKKINRVQLVQLANQRKHLLSI